MRGGCGPAEGYRRLFCWVLRGASEGLRDGDFVDGDIEGVADGDIDGRTVGESERRANGEFLSKLAGTI